MAEECFFKFKFQCDGRQEKLTESGLNRIENIIKCSKIYHDGVDKSLENSLRENHDLTIKCHKSCVSTYTSTTQIQRYIKRTKQVEEPSVIPQKKTRLSNVSTFSFQQHCIFCGEDCNLERDAKNPARWKPAYLCREIEPKKDNKSLKQSLLDICDCRDDEWASTVRLRIQGAISDLHAADARYHVACRCSFTGSRAVATAACSKTTSESVDAAFNSLIQTVREDLTRVWNSVELFNSYVEYGGTNLSRKGLVKSVSECFGEDLLVLCSPGIASILIFRSKASSVFKLASDEEDDLDIALHEIAKKIKTEVQDIPADKRHYKTTVSSDIAMESLSPTVLALLTKLSPKLDHTLPATMIGSIITSTLHNHPTDLQIDLGVLIRDSKKLINLLHAFGVTCSYDEILRFKKSAAFSAAADMDFLGISQADSGLIQVVVDNFDADISSQNGKLSTHSLAVLFTQKEQDQIPHDTLPTIKRIKKSEMSEPVEYELQVQRFNGPKNPELPQQAAMKSVLPLKVLAHKVLSRQRADQTDAAFMEDVLTKDRCPEFNGYNTANSRQQGVSVQPKTRAVYLPLIDMIPSDPDTMMTALAQAQQLTSKMGQEFVIITCDLQLYRVALHVIWTYPDRFSNVIMRLGGMHCLMSFVGSIGSLMAESGLAEVLSAVFGGVPKMLSGKKFPQNVRAMCLVAEEVLRQILEEHPIQHKKELMNKLEDLASKSKTTKLWVDMLIKPVFIMMMFIRAEREADWPLHLEALRMMLPYFFAAGHVHYARYGLYYLRSMEALPANVLDLFMKGEHVMRHNPGIWNGIWSDMFIESTFMRYGHGKGGIIGITLKPETLKTWALSLHICSKLEADITEMVNGENDKTQNVHKEESQARIFSDGKDREGIRHKLEMCINPLDPASHPEGIVNIVNGIVGPSTVNVHDSVAIGSEQMSEFESTWPEHFHHTISKRVTTMAVTKNSMSVGETKVFDTNLIYSRVIGLQASSRAIDIKQLLSHELAPIPTSMFTDAGEMRCSKAKSVLKNQLQVEVSSRKASSTDVTIIDGSALLWVIHWPAGGTVKDYVSNFRRHIEKRLEKGDVYLVFDRYYEYSTKSVARSARKTEASRVHQLNVTTQLRPQKVVLTVTENKKQLINIICSELKGDTSFHRDHIHKHKLVITSQDKTPIEISNGGVILSRSDMATTHEEADIVLVQQMLTVSRENPAGITVLSDDTDVFVLLLHYYLEDGLKLLVTMESPAKDRVVVDIGKTVEKHQNFIPEILAAHALSGCDTVACCFGIGKNTVLKVVRSGISLSLLGYIDAPLPAVIDQATLFMTACYGQKCDTMSNARLTAWAGKTGKGQVSTPKLCSLPPTTEAFVENVKRAHHQASMWRSAKEEDPPVLDVEKYGWKKDKVNRSLVPTTIPEAVNLAPDSVLKLIRCGCKSGTPCNSSRCGCRSANLSCTVFCACHDGGCCNANIS